MLRSKPPAGGTGLPPWHKAQPLAWRLLAACAVAYLLLVVWQLPILWQLNQPAGRTKQTTTSSSSSDDEPVLPPAVGGVAAAATLQQQQARRLRYPLWWHAPFFSGTGYGTEAISYIVGLLQHSQVQREDVWISQSGDKLEEGVVRSLEHSTLQLLQAQEYNALARGKLPQHELDRPAVAICHSFPDCWLLSADANSMRVPGCPCPPPELSELVAYKIGRTMFETAGLPAHLVAHANAMDEVWVPTEFNRQTFAAAGVAAEKLFVVPQGVDDSLFDPARHQPLLLRELPDAQLITGAPLPASSRGSRRPRYVFLSVFKFEARKGWDVLLNAYLNEFSGAEAVELHIVTKAFGKGKENFREQLQSWMRRRLGLQAEQLGALPPVFLHAKHVDDALYPQLYASADCVVLPTRGEGWGRPQMEAMSMARPLITTNWSGPTAYISEAVAYPLAVEGLSAADADMNATAMDASDVNAYFSGQRWAQPSVTHLRELMRRVVSRPGEAAAKGAAARRHIQQHFSPAVITRHIRRHVLRVQDKLGPDLRLPPREKRQQDRAQKALCGAYPQLCTQGAAGVAEAARRAQSAFSAYRANAPDALAGGGGRLTVAEMLMMPSQEHLVPGGSSSPQHRRHW